MTYDLLVIGGGINGAGIARDAAGRGLSVLLVEAADLAAATSSASSKLIHGGLRYLEHYEFRLVAEALAEREILLRIAAHLASPMRFVMPHVPQLRPRWMIGIGLFLYDHLARRSVLPGSRRVRLDAPPYRGILKPEFRHGFAYSDCRVDDARLVIANARDAAERGAHIRVRTQCVSARRTGDQWNAILSGGEAVRARAVVNVAGPWVKHVLNERLGQPSRDEVRLVQGSHIVVPRLYEGSHAYILQNDDRRVVFMIPFEEQFTLIGTTEVPLEGDPASAKPSDAEVEYLCRAASRYLPTRVEPSAVRWRFAGVRPLYDDGSGDPSAVTRDYSLRLDDEAGAAPALSVFGGKITTYRSLAEHVLKKLAHYFPCARGAWTDRAAFAGSDFRDRNEAFASLSASYPDLPGEVLRAVFRRHGALASEVLGDGKVGEHYGAGLTEREVQYFVEREWAMSAEDVLWRRSKAGLHMEEAQRRRVLEVMGR
ncbi:MAG: glycerol-3-phosphate dehydrogenase [Betaproteobacteria bacterium]|nr:MAG: glycerol-3-phosphate dehydrogenase [Betaproteobacteria bacterium]